MNGEGMLPEWFTPKQLATAQGWSEDRARKALDDLVRGRLAMRDADGRYSISGMGLAVGERLGIVRPLDLKAGGWKSA